MKRIAIDEPLVLYFGGIMFFGLKLVILYGKIGLE